MKKAVLLSAMLLVFGAGTQADGYVLVYYMFGAVQTVDIAAEEGGTKGVGGYIVLDVNDSTGVCDASSVVLYGREGRGESIYTIYDDVVGLETYGRNAVVRMDTGAGLKIMLTGRANARVFGLPAGTRAASSLNGGIWLEEGQLFDLEEVLVGAGSVQARLSVWLTRMANYRFEDIEEVVDLFVENLEARGYEYLEEEPEDEEPPLLR